MITTNRIGIGRCSNPKCDAIHIFFFDPDDKDKLVAVGAVRRNKQAAMIKIMQEIAYEIATEAKA